MINNFVKPMLARSLTNTADIDRFAVGLQPKYDGVRAILIEGVFYSRNAKPIKNIGLQQLWGKVKNRYPIDGELLIRDNPTGARAFARTTEALATHADPDAVCFNVFDIVTMDNYSARHALLTRQMQLNYRGLLNSGRALIVPTVWAHSAAAVDDYERSALGAGWEGVMLRHDALHSGYEPGVRSKNLLKLKRFADAEAEVVGYEPKYHNANEAVRDASTGRSKRSSKAEGLVALETLGALRCRLPGSSGVEFGVGSGFTDAEREALWAARDTLIGRTVKYRFQPSGTDVAPRFPTFVGWYEE